MAIPGHLLLPWLLALCVPAVCAGAPISHGYPGDRDIDKHPAVLFHSNFDRQLSGWTRHTRDPGRLAVVPAPGLAVSGDQVLRVRISREYLQRSPTLSTFAEYRLPRPVDTLYWRFYARIDAGTAAPHHWVRVFAEGPGFFRRWPAGSRPDGDQGFSVGLDLHRDGLLSFYAYWHEMRSWVCNDGTLTPGCAGRQGGARPRNPYYGNVFHPAGQSALPRDEWVCVEMAVVANTPDAHDGRLALWVNDELRGEYRTGTPRGRWLRQNFFTHGEYYRDEQAFEGFNFRTDPAVRIARISLDTYYELASLERQARQGTPVSDEQVFWYDAIVVATERIGCLHEGPPRAPDA